MNRSARGGCLSAGRRVKSRVISEDNVRNRGPPVAISGIDGDLMASFAHAQRFQLALGVRPHEYRRQRRVEWVALAFAERPVEPWSCS